MSVDDDDNTPLHYAALCGHRKVVILLVLWYNADLNACNVHDVSPLQLAAMNGHKHVVKVIISELNRQAKFDVKGSQSQAALTALVKWDIKR